jgi:hypothetical protein
MISRPKYTMRESHNILELQVLKQAQCIIRQRRGNECNYNIVRRMVRPHYPLWIGQHFLTKPNTQQYAVGDEARGIYSLYLQKPMRKIGCKLVQNQRRYRCRSRLSFRVGHSPKTGKGRSGDKPKPEPHPIDPGKQHLYMI